MEPGQIQLASVIAIGGVFAYLTALSARRANRVAQSRPLLLFYAGFLALALAQVAAAVLELQPPTTTDAFDAIDVLFLVHYVALLSGAILVFLSFGRHPFRWAPAMTGLLWAGPALQFAVAFVFFFVVLHAGFNHIRQARPGSLRTALGFFALLVSHLMHIYEYFPQNPRNITGEAFGVVGFVLLWLARPRLPSTE